MLTLCPPILFAPDTPERDNAGGGGGGGGGGAFGPEERSGAKTTSTGVGPVAPETSVGQSGINEPGYLPPSPGAMEDDGYHVPAARRRSLFVRAIYDTFGQTGARIAGIWIVLLALIAAFAPFLANSRPYIANWSDGRTTFPLFGALTWVDITLAVLALAVIGLVIVRRFLDFELRYELAGLVAVVAIVAPVSYFLADPPRLETYERFRVAKESGELTSAIMAPVPFSPNDANRDVDRTRPQQPPSGRHWLGTTVYGEDLLSRLIFATRIALAIGFIATGISTVIGIALGAVMGYFAGTLDLLLMRFVEMVEVVPRLVLLMIVVTFFSEGWLKDLRLYLMMVTIGLISWTGDARFIRAEFLKLRKQDFVQACVATGLPLRNLLFRHMLPNGVAPVLVNVSFGIAGAILLESVLSFLGLGLEAEQASWGQLLDQARQGGSGFNWWIATFPGLAIFLTVFAYILIGEAMRDAIDPKLKKAEG